MNICFEGMRALPEAWVKCELFFSFVGKGALDDPGQ
jgi:hypothetical protein